MGLKKEFYLFAAGMQEDYGASLGYDEETGELMYVVCPECGTHIEFEDWYLNQQWDGSVACYGCNYKYS